jgi:hypothetical protein
MIKAQGLLDCLTTKTYQTAILSYNSHYDHSQMNWIHLNYNSTDRGGIVSYT